MLVASREHLSITHVKYDTRLTLGQEKNVQRFGWTRNRTGAHRKRVGGFHPSFGSVCARVSSECEARMGPMRFRKPESVQAGDPFSVLYVPLCMPSVFCRFQSMGFIGKLGERENFTIFQMMTGLLPGDTEPLADLRFRPRKL